MAMPTDARTRTQTQAIVASLRRLRSRARWTLIWTAGSLILALAIAAAVLLGLADYVLRMPSALRTVLWLAAVGAGATLVWRWVVPVWRFRPTLTDLALHVERSPEGARAGLGSLLASAVDFSDEAHPDVSAATRALAQTVQAQAEAKFGQVHTAPLVNPRRLIQGACALLVGVMLTACLYAVWPTLTVIGAQRVLLPWSSASWPTRTEIVDATQKHVHPLGSAISLRAVLTKSDQAVGQSTVAARYRLILDSREEPVRRALLTAQKRVVDVIAEDPSRSGSGELYERLIEPFGVAAGAQGFDPAIDAEFEYWFETSDNQTRPARIRLVASPSVVSARAIVTPPAYVGSVASGAVIAAGTVDMGSGSDARALLGPILAGSRVRMTIDLNKPIPAPGDDAASRASQAQRLFADASLADAITAWGDAGAISLDFIATHSLRLPVSLTDSYGLTSPEDVVFMLDVIRDRPATASIIDPPEDESVLPTAVLGLIAEGRDDAGLAWISMESVHARPPGGSLGAPAEALAEGVEIVRRVIDVGTGQPLLVADVRTVLDLGPYGATPGDEVWLTALAQDTYIVDGVTHEPGRSAVRRLRIVSPDQFQAQIRSELSSVRETAKRLDEEQAAIRASAAREGATEANRARQAGVTDRLAGLEQVMQRLAERAQRNRLGDEALEDQLAEGQRLVQRGAEQSRQASGAMNTGRMPDPTLEPGEQRQVEAAQDQVRRNLTDLIELLDAGEDGWLARRQLEELIERQRDLMSRTADATERTLGRDSGDLSPQERAALDMIAEQQRDLAQRAAQALEDLQQRAEALQQRDPTQAGAMASAADRGRQQQVPSRLEDAAQQIEQNQGESAQQSQQQALASLEQMLEDIQNAQRTRDETLRRILASVIESLNALIAVQRRELAALDRAEASGSAAGLDAPMIRLHTNTLGVESMVRVGFRELAALADLVKEAAEAQTTAIAVLRSPRFDAPAAREAEQRSLSLLEQALEEAQRQRDAAAQRDLERQRAELRRAYRETLEQQVVLRGETATFVDKEITRRQRVSVRRLGDRQHDVRERLREVREMLDRAEAPALFAFAHDRLDSLTSSSARVLRLGEATRGVLAEQDSAARLLQSLLRALDDRRDREDDFREHEQGEGGEGQGGSGQEEGLIPEMAELLLLRELQQELVEATRIADETPGADVEAIGELQAAIAEHAAELVQRIRAPAPTPRGEEPSP